MRSITTDPESTFSAQRRRFVGMTGALALSTWLPARAALAVEHDHQHHHDDAAAPGVKRSELQIRLPEVALVRQDGARVGLAKELDERSQPVFLTFIYTSCTTVCPVISKIFSDLQGALGPDLNRVKLVSVSIDPEYDTPGRLSDYANRFGAKPQWQSYTGTLAASVAVQKAFNTYRGDKMNHTPVAFVRAAPGKPWVRYDGFVSPQALVQEYRAQLGKA